MKAHCKEFSIEKMAQVLQVSCSGFYSPRKDQNYAALDEQIKEVFKENKGHYGSPRVYAALKRQDIPCSRYKVEQRMRILGLYAGKKKRKPKTTIGLKRGSNLLARDFTANAPNEKWCTDISYIPVKGGFMYLSVILDLYARKVVSWVLRDHMEQGLILETLEKALQKRILSKFLIFHSDRGSQYRAESVRNLLMKRGICASQGFSAYDNAAKESFFGSLKAELMPSGMRFESQEEAKLKLFEYIEIYYNKKRLHSTLGYMTPDEFEKQRRPA